MRWMKGLGAIVFAAGSLAAQDAWDPSFKLVAGRGGQAAEDGAGSTWQLGLSAEGSYPLPSGCGSIVLEGGFRKFLNATAKDPAIPDPLSAPSSGSSTFKGTDLESNSQGWLIGALWRRGIGPMGLYVEGGLRWTSYISRETWTDRQVTVTSTGAVTEAGAARTGSFSHKGFGPVIGAGFRFNELTNLDLEVSRQTVPTAAGGTRGLTVVELGLGTHF